MSAGRMDADLFHRIFPVHSEIPIVDKDAPGFVACRWWIARHEKNMQFVVPSEYAPVPRGGLLKMIKKVSAAENEDLTEDLALRIEPIGSYGDDADGPLKPGEEFDFGQRVYRCKSFEVVIQGLFGPLLDGLTVVGSGPESPVIGLTPKGSFAACVMPLRPGSIRQPGEPFSSLEPGQTDQKGRAS